MLSIKLDVLAEILPFGENLTFWTNFDVLNEIRSFAQNSTFSFEIHRLAQSLTFRSKFDFLGEIRLFSGKPSAVAMSLSNYIILHEEQKVLTAHFSEKNKKNDGVDYICFNAFKILIPDTFITQFTNHKMTML